MPSWNKSSVSIPLYYTIPEMDLIDCFGTFNHLIFITISLIWICDILKHHHIFTLNSHINCIPFSPKKFSKKKKKRAYAQIWLVILYFQVSRDPFIFNPGNRLTGQSHPFRLSLVSWFLCKQRLRLAGYFSFFRKSSTCHSLVKILCARLTKELEYSYPHPYYTILLKIFNN